MKDLFEVIKFGVIICKILEDSEDFYVQEQAMYIEDNLLDTEYYLIHYYTMLSNEYTQVRKTIWDMIEQLDSLFKAA